MAIVVKSRTVEPRDLAALLVGHDPGQARRTGLVVGEDLEHLAATVTHELRSKTLLEVVGEKARQLRRAPRAVIASQAVTTAAGLPPISVGKSLLTPWASWPHVPARTGPFVTRKADSWTYPQG